MGCVVSILGFVMALFGTFYGGFADAESQVVVFLVGVNICVLGLYAALRDG